MLVQTIMLWVDLEEEVEHTVSVVEVEVVAGIQEVPDQMTVFTTPSIMAVVVVVAHSVLMACQIVPPHSTSGWDMCT